MCIIEEMKKASETVDYRGYNYTLSSVIEILILGLIAIPFDIDTLLRRKRLEPWRFSPLRLPSQTWNCYMCKMTTLY